MSEIEKAKILCEKQASCFETECTAECAGCPNETNPDDFKIALQSVIIPILQEQQEREKGCEYCKEQYDLDTKSAFEPSLFVEGNVLKALRYDEADSKAQINFCPMCGRDLRKPEAPNEA